MVADRNINPDDSTENVTSSLRSMVSFCGMHAAVVAVTGVTTIDLVNKVYDRYGSFPVTEDLSDRTHDEYLKARARGEAGDL